MGTSRPSEVLTGSTDFYSIYTLIDITDSGILSPKTDAKGFFQSQNLNTFIQCISLRAQPVLSSINKVDAVDLSDYDFGSNMTGIHDVWIFKFASETADAWNKDVDPVYFLRDDFNKTPVHTTLDETANINPEQIDTGSNNKNTYFTFSENV
jgi:hypothetical protein|tara:strand:+ start:3661 stop:4116 length:456 start_codon:yes stop_codon:yes gene_type:complete